MHVNGSATQRSTWDDRSRRDPSARRGLDPSARRGLTVLCLLTVWIAWGGTYPAIRVMVETVPPLLGTSVRFLVAGAVLAAVLALAGRLRATRRELAGAALIGTVILGDIGVLAVAEQEVPAGLAALIIASVPLWIVLLQTAAREPVPRRTVAAVLAGLAGMGLLIDPGGQAPVVWLLVLVAAAAVEAAGQFYSRFTPLPVDPLTNGTIQLLAAGVALGIAGLAFGEADDLDASAFSSDSLLAFAYLVVPARSSPTRPSPGCSETCRSPRSRPTRTSIRWWPSRRAGACWASASRRIWPSAAP
jgi:drug/metabolite transporter (DMT)-like permease